MTNRLANTVKRLRLAKGLSRLELGNAIGRTRQAIRYIEEGITRQPDADTLVALAAALGCPLADLMPEPPARRHAPEGGEEAR